MPRIPTIVSHIVSLEFDTLIYFMARNAINENVRINKPNIKNSKKLSNTLQNKLLSSSVSYNSIKNGVKKANVTKSKIRSICYKPFTLSYSVSFNHELEISNGIVAKKPITISILNTTIALPIQTRTVPSSLRSVNNKNMNKETPTHIMENMTVKIISHTSTIILIIIIKLLLLNTLNLFILSFCVYKYSFLHLILFKLTYI